LRWIAADFAAHIAMLHGFHPAFEHGGGNPPFWSLACEEYLYALYFLLLGYRKQRSMLGFVFVSFACGLLLCPGLTSRFNIDSPWAKLIATSAVALWVQWCLGALAAEAYVGLIRLPEWCYSSWFAIAWIIAARLADSRVAFLSAALWGMAFFTFVNAIVRCEVRGRWPRNAVVDWFASVGGFSYSLYLVHFPVQGVLCRFTDRLSGNPTLYPLHVLLLWLASYYVAKVLFSGVESHFIETSKPPRIRGVAELPERVPAV
jgi:peptidoglycan/LPS O-acetylase OafA/YrhL